MPKVDELLAQERALMSHIARSNAKLTLLRAKLRRALARREHAKLRTRKQGARP
jgi:hypothetical protein